MSVVAPVYDKSDPRQEKLYPYHIPPTPEWAEEKDLFGQGAMMGAGAGMFIRNPLFIWGSMLMGLVNFVNQKPLRTPSDAGSPLATLGMGIMGIVSLAVPKMTIPAGAAAPAPVVSA